MSNYTIREVEIFSGIKAHTLRVWERRYDLHISKTLRNQQRIFSNDDLKTLLRIAYLYNTGIKISRLASMHEDEIKAMATRLRDAEEPLEIYLNLAIEAMIDLKPDLLNHFISDAIHQYDFEKVIYHLIIPLARQAALFGQISKSRNLREMLTHSIIQQKIINETENILHPETVFEQLFILFTPPDYYYEINLLIVNYLLKKSGSATLYLGKNVSIDVLKKIIELYPQSTLYFDASGDAPDTKFREYITSLSETFPSSKILYSGNKIITQFASLPKHIQVFDSYEALLYWASKGVFSF